MPAQGAALGIGSGIENSNALKGQNRFVVKNLVSPFQAWADSHSDRIPRADPASGVPPAWASFFGPFGAAEKRNTKITKGGYPPFPPYEGGIQGGFEGPAAWHAQASPRPPLPPFARGGFIGAPFARGGISLSRLGWGSPAWPDTLPCRHPVASHRMRFASLPSCLHNALSAIRAGCLRNSG
jgi:hypothetical protein